MNLHTVTDLDETTRHRLLADDQRRFVVESLQTARDGVETTLDDLANHVSRAAKRTDDRDDVDRRALRVRLHHVHLPMLAEAGLLEYHPETRQIRLGRSWSVAASASSP